MLLIVECALFSTCCESWPQIYSLGGARISLYNFSKVGCHFQSIFFYPIDPRSGSNIVYPSLTVFCRLTIKSVRRSDLGNYTCNARNSLGSVKETIALRGKVATHLWMFVKTEKNHGWHQKCNFMRDLFRVGHHYGAAYDGIRRKP